MSAFGWILLMASYVAAGFLGAIIQGYFADKELFAAWEERDRVWDDAHRPVDGETTDAR